VKPIQLFNGRWSIFWATTFTFELQLFDEYLFRRLGEPPLNATVLLDESCADAMWEAIPPEESWRLRHVNRDYLVRGISFGTGRFHPKTYFFANEQEGSVVVGSGNLGRRGLDRGNEVFSRFDSRDPEGLAAIRKWRDWMSGLVETTDDEMLKGRWWNVRTQAKWLVGTAGGNFVSNGSSPIVESFTHGLQPPVDELHLTAPFFDEDASAVQLLVERLRPSVACVYIAERTSVEGGQLRAALGVAAQRRVMLYQTPFVHAKLIAAITGASGRLLGGSANLSRAALFATPEAETWSNVEAGTIVEGPADTLRALFRPVHIESVEVGEEALDGLHFERSPDEEAFAPTMRLRRAQLEVDRKISMEVAGDIPTEARLTDGNTTLRVAPGRAQTLEPLPEGEGGRLVWLQGASGDPISNRVPLDHPRALARWLMSSTQQASRPRELDESDLGTPIGRMLQQLNDDCIFDIDETEAARRAEHVIGTEAESEETDADFWDRLGREELMLDSRTARYQGLAAGPIDEDDDVLRLLRLMLDKTPEERRALHLAESPGLEPDDGEGDHHPRGQLWSPTTRLKVRLNNVMRRWCLALSDSRLRWLSPYAPVRNFTALARAVAECWEEGYLEESKLLVLLQVLFERFIGTPALPGYLTSLDEDQRAKALERLPDEARTLATALAFAALRPGGSWEDLIFDWQLFVGPGLDLGLFAPTEPAAKMATRLTDQQVDGADVEDRLVWAVRFIDDPHWCGRMATELDLSSVVFSDGAFVGPYKASLSVDGIPEPLDDPRLVRLIKQLFDYRGTQGMTVIAGNWRISILLDDLAYARPPSKGTDLMESRVAISKTGLDSLASTGGTLRELFDGVTAAAG
jgi:hypothetical protein